MEETKIEPEGGVRGGQAMQRAVITEPVPDEPVNVNGVADVAGAAGTTGEAAPDGTVSVAGAVASVVGAAAAPGEAMAPETPEESVNSAEQSAAEDSAEAAESAVALPTISVATSSDDMPTTAIPLTRERRSQANRRRAKRAAATRKLAPLQRLRKHKGLIRRAKDVVRKVTIALFTFWLNFSTALCKLLGWFPCVKPYVGYGTEDYSRLICRTIYEPRRPTMGPVRGIQAMLEVPAAGQRVKIKIDGVPLRTVQIGTVEIYDPVEASRAKTAEYAVSDSSGYLDLLAEHTLKPGTHSVTCKVPGRAPVAAELFTIPSDCPVGIISDIDDTILVTQVPTVWKAAYNMLLMSPRKRASVPGMAVMYNKIHEMFPSSPFFYLSTSPWNIERAVHSFIRDYGFPDGPLLLRDLDPRPKTFVPSGVQHKLEYAEQLMADFPDMKFILIGDDGQKDPTTYATICKRFPGRVLAIGIRQLSPREASGGFGGVAGMSMTQPIPDVDVPVFTGATGSNMMKTMLPYLEQFRQK